MKQKPSKNVSHTKNPGWSCWWATRLENTLINARNGSREKKPRKAETEMGERHHIYVRYDDSGKQSGGGPATISQ